MTRIWMMSAALLAMTATAGAQSPEMAKTEMGGTMNVTRTGCVERAERNGVFVLTRVEDAIANGMPDRMKTNDVGTMAHDKTPMGGMKTKDAVTDVIVLAGRTDLKKHVGQKVSVMGAIASANGKQMPARPTLTVNKLMVIANHCAGATR